MNRFVALLQRKKNYFYVLLTVLLVLLLVSTCSLNVKPSLLQTALLNSNDISAFQQFGYDVQAREDGTFLYTPSNNDPQILIPYQGTGLTKIVVTMSAEAVPSAGDFRLYFKGVGETFSEGSAAYGCLEGNQISFVAEKETFEEFRLDVNAPFIPTNISFEQVTALTPVRQFEWISAVVFLVLVILLILFDKKIGYFSSVKELICSMYQSLCTEFAEKRYWHAVLHIGMWLSTAAFAITMIILLCFSIFTVNMMWLMLALTSLAVFLQVLYRVVTENGVKPAAVFLAVALLVGLFFAYINPPTLNVSNDDQIHYFRAELISRQLFGHTRTYADEVQASLQYNLGSSKADFEGTNLKMLYFDSIELADKGVHVNYYSYIAYLPLSVLIFFSDIFSVDFILQMTILRMAYLLIYVFVCYLGIRKLKSGGYLFSVIALSPLFLFLASTINYDFWLTAFLTYAFAVFVSELQTPEKKLSRANVVRMLAASAIGCGPKATYFFCFFPFFFMNKEKFENNKARKRYLLATLAVMGAVLATFILPFFIDMNSVNDVRGGAVNATEQVKLILSNPFRYAGILIQFLLGYTSLGRANSQIANYAYYGNSSGIFASVTLMLLAFCTFADKHECDRFVNVRAFKRSTLFTCLVQMVIFTTAMYIGYTPVGSSSIGGVQWRYIAPVLFPLLYCVGSTRILSTIREKVMSAVVFFPMSIVLLLSMTEVYILRLK